MFILELTLRSWNHSEENKRRTLQRNDIAAAITRTDIFDFLVSVCLQSSTMVHMPSSRHCCCCLWFAQPVCATSKKARVLNILSCTLCAAASRLVLCELQVDIVPREERDDAAMMPRVPQPMSGAMAGKLHCIALQNMTLHACVTMSACIL